MSKFKTAAPTGTAENPMVVLKRLLRYLKPYRLRLAVVFLCIIFSALASTISATFLKTLIMITSHHCCWNRMRITADCCR